MYPGPDVLTLSHDSIKKRYIDEFVFLQPMVIINISRSSVGNPARHSTTNKKWNHWRPYYNNQKKINLDLLKIDKNIIKHSIAYFNYYYFIRGIKFNSELFMRLMKSKMAFFQCISLNLSRIKYFLILDACLFRILS